MVTVFEHIQGKLGYYRVINLTKMYLIFNIQHKSKENMTTKIIPNMEFTDAIYLY